MKLLRSRKALSPVVASIILIAVTVAVSIAVAAWMGALAGLFMGGAENLNVGNPWGWNLTGQTGNDYVFVNVTNNGGSAITLSSVRIGNDQATFVCNYSSKTSANVGANPPITLAPGESAGLKIIYTGKDFEAGVPYTIKLITSNNKEFSTIGTPPGP
jgi:flagellin-like protein